MDKPYPTFPIGSVGYNLLQLREDAEQRIGIEYDIREFHQTVLGQGALPLSVLNTVVNDWIDTFCWRV